MRRQKNIAQLKEQTRNTEIQINEEEIGKLPEKEFRILIVNMKVAQSCPTLCNPMDCIVCGILQARILEWIAFPFSRGSYQPMDWTQVSHIAGRFFTWVTREAQEYWSG